MTVAQLIEELKKHPQDLQVFSSTEDDYGYAVEDAAEICVVDVFIHGDIQEVLFIGDGQGVLATLPGDVELED